MKISLKIHYAFTIYSFHIIFFFLWNQCGTSSVNINLYIRKDSFLRNDTRLLFVITVTK